MKNLKALALIISSILLIMFVVMVFAEDPLEEKYEAVLQSRMDQENIQDESLILQLYPELKVVKEQIDQIHSLKLQIMKVAANPSPVISKQEGEDFTTNRNNIRKLYDDTFHLLDGLESPSVAINQK